MKLFYLIFAVFLAQTAHADCIVNTFYSYRFPVGGSSKYLASRQINTYDASHTQTHQLNQNWDTGSLFWINDTKVDYTYNSNNLLVQYYAYKWDIGSNSWKNGNLAVYVHDGSNNVI